MKTDGILTFTAKNKKGITTELQQLLEQRLAANEDLLFLDFATLAGGLFPRSALLALTSHRLLLIAFNFFSLDEIVSVPWWEIKHFYLLPPKKVNWFAPSARFAELCYVSGGQEKTITFAVGRSGQAERTHALVKNLSLRFAAAETQIFVVADTLIYYTQGQVRHIRLHHWISNAILDELHQSIYVLLSNEAVVQNRLYNLVSLDYHGEIKWRGELPTGKGVPDSFVRVEFSEGEIIGYTWSGFLCKLASASGRIIELQRAVGSRHSRGDLEAYSADGRQKATLILAGEDRLGNRLYRLFIESSHFFKERLFGAQAHWSPDGRYLAVQEFFFSHLHGIQSVGVVLFDLETNREALVEKSVSRSFAPQGWKSAETLLYGPGKGKNAQEISVQRVFWLPLRNVGLEVSR
ncbi:MAG: hypothetical protein GX058_05215 [Firmicutes bacterium]|nr:hypothetical protein [Bacillota bacterium]